MFLLTLLACDASVRSRPWPDLPVPATDSAHGTPADSGHPGDSADTAPPPGPCAPDGAPVGAACMDLYEAPNRAGALPLVMYSFDEAAAWCAARTKRLCFDDEWLAACEGPDSSAYPYGDAHDPGVCNDEETWIVYSQSTLNGWPSGAAGPNVDSLDALWEAAGTDSAVVAHLQELYQGEGGGENPGCVGPAGVFDLSGNVEEWTRRRDGGTTSFHGNLKGRYWAESRTCQSGVTTHGDGFRFYEIGFRCCWDLGG